MQRKCHKCNTLFEAVPADRTVCDACTTKETLTKGYKKCKECGKVFNPGKAQQRKFCYECRPATVKKEKVSIEAKPIARATFNPTVKDEIKQIATNARVIIKTPEYKGVTRDDFIRLMGEEFKEIMALFKRKNKAYGDKEGGDALHNFRKAANLLGGDTYPNMFIAAEVYKIKHNEALSKGIEVSECAERLRDNILYSLFQLAMVKEFNKSKVGGGLNE